MRSFERFVAAIFIVAGVGCSEVHDRVLPRAEPGLAALMLDGESAADAAVPDDDAGVAEPPRNPSTPIGYWSFDDCGHPAADPGLFSDTSGSMNYAQHSDAVVCAEGRRNNAVLLGAPGASIQVPMVPAYNLAAGMTLGAWVKPQSVHRTQTLFRKRGEHGSAFGLFISHGRYRFVLRLASGRLVGVSAPAPSNTWTHVTVTYDGTLLKLYVNGAEADRARARGTIIESDGPLVLGSDEHWPYVGLLDSVWLNTVAASEETILALTCLPEYALRDVSEPHPAVPAGTIVPYTAEIENKNPVECPRFQYWLFVGSDAPELDVYPSRTYSIHLESGEKYRFAYEATIAADAEPGRYEMQVATLALDPVSFDGVSRYTTIAPVYEVAAPTGCHVAPARELLIRDVSVVDDPVRTGAGGVWSFGELMSALAPSEAAAPAFTEAFFRTFQVPQQVNGFTVAPLPKLEEVVLTPWPRTQDSALDLSRAPWKLLAITNRTDLADPQRGRGGEVHFAYGLVDSAGQPLDFTLNFEYELPAHNEAEARAWTDRFRALHALPFPSEGYNQALAEITERVTRRDAAAFIDIQTDEYALGDDPNNRFRVYRLTSDAKTLEPVPLRATPDVSFNLTETLAGFINANQQAILDGSLVFPALLDGAPFQAGEVSTLVDMWEAPGIDPEARFAFSLPTCNGCHRNETHTSYHHIAPRAAGTKSEVSHYVTGEIVGDFISETKRNFAELKRWQEASQARYCRP